MKSALALLLTALPCSAALTVYTDYATWAAAVGVPIQTITFQGPVGGPFGAGLTTGGVNFQGSSAGSWNGYLYTNNFGYCAATNCLIGPPTEAGALGATDGYIRSTPGWPVTAVAMEAGAYISGGDIPVFRFSNGDSYTGPAQPGLPVFYGFISTTPFQYVDYHISAGSSGGDFTVIDTFYVPTPEPGTWVFGLTGLALAGIGARRRNYGR